MWRLSLISLLFIISACNKNGEIDGHVTTSDNMPVGNAEVSIGDKSTMSDATGYFKIEEVNEGSHVLKTSISKEDGTSSMSEENVQVEARTMNSYTLTIPNFITLYVSDTSENIENKLITLKWNASSAQDFFEYKVYRHSSAGLDESTGTLVFVSTNISDTTFIDSLTHNVNAYYRVYIRNTTGPIGTSNILLFSNGNFTNNLTITTGILHLGNLEAGQTLWFKFLAEEEAFYNIAWYDNWWPQYTMPSMYVTAYRENQITTYFSKKRLIQMNGSPEVIIAQADEYVYLKIEGYDASSAGSFGISVEKLNTNTAQQIATDSTVMTTQISAGEVELYYAEVEQSTNYILSFLGDDQVGAYGDNVVVMLDAIGQDSKTKFLYRVIPGGNMFGGPSLHEIQATNTERIYFALVGAYWWNDRTVSVAIKED